MFRAGRGKVVRDEIQKLIRVPFFVPESFLEGNRGGGMSSVVFGGRVNP